MLTTKPEETAGACAVAVLSPVSALRMNAAIFSTFRVAPLRWLDAGGVGVATDGGLLGYRLSVL